MFVTDADTADFAAARTMPPGWTPPDRPAVIDDGQAFTDAWSDTRYRLLDDSFVRAHRDAYDRYADRIWQATGQRVRYQGLFPETTGPVPPDSLEGTARTSRDKFFADVQAVADRHPGAFPVRTADDIAAEVKAVGQSLAAERHRGERSGLYDFLGEAAAQMTSPGNLVSLLYGAPGAARGAAATLAGKLAAIGKTAAIEGAIGGVATAAQQPAVMDFNARIGIPYATGQAAEAVAGGAVGGAVIGGGLKAAGFGLKGLLSRWREARSAGHVADTPETRAAESVLDNQVSRADANPFPPTIDGDVTHANALDRATADVLDGRPVDVAGRIPGPDRVYADVRGQLLRAGRPLEETDAVATLWRERYAARAEATGRDAWELYRESAPEIRSRDPVGAGGVTLEQPAWHGSPHVFDRFSLDHIDRGEGAQTFGWGLYFAEHKSVAQFYRERLTRRTGKAGRLYQVDIPDDGAYLHWEKPLGEQPEVVREAILSITDAIYMRPMAMAKIAPDIEQIKNGNATGQQIYELFSRVIWTPRDTSFALREAGIPGIKYLDGLSRDSGEGSHNYVVFDDSLVNVTSYEQSGGKAFSPITTLRGDELAPLDADIKTLREAAQAHWQANIKGTTATSPELGEITFTNKGEKKFFATSADARKLRLVPVLKDIVRGAKVVAREEATPKGPNDNIAAYYWLETDVRLGAEDLRVGVTIFEDNKGNKFYNLTPDREEGAQRARSNSGGNAPSDAGKAHDQSVAPSATDINLTIMEGGQRSAPRGSITFPDAGLGHGPAVIRLFQTADRSTLLHESGHLWLEELRADALGASSSTSGRGAPDAPGHGAPDQIAADWRTVTDWLGADTHAPLTREHHETWAKAFESYLMDGQAPSARLRDVFQRFATWLATVYDRLIGTGVTPSPEVRAVMDRLFAGNAETAAWRRGQRVPESLRPPRERPWTMTEWLRRNGGLFDDMNGELATMGITPRTMPGLVRKEPRRNRVVGNQTIAEGGRKLDDAALAAWEAGYLSHFAERPTVQQFLDALDGDFNGHAPRYRDDDLATVAAWDAHHEHWADVDRADLDPRGMTDAELNAAMARRHAAETSAMEGDATAASPPPMADRDWFDLARADIIEADRLLAEGDHTVPLGDVLDADGNTVKRSAREMMAEAQGEVDLADVFKLCVGI